MIQQLTNADTERLTDEVTELVCRSARSTALGAEGALSNGLVEEFLERDLLDLVSQRYPFNAFTTTWLTFIAPVIDASIAARVAAVR